ncbi:MAG: exodeoxyribonuclease subunit gamma [Bacteroidota bacterium]|jgi:exodeoxyribonuclease V gamma subunit
MGITLNVSNALSPLSLQLAGDLKAITGDPFRAQWVITQTEGMNSWLKTALAKELGIASNIRFCKPNDIVSRVHQLCTYPARPALDSETTRWYLYTLLGSQAFREAHPDIQAYFGSNDIKRIALADQLADLFDQYQVYRYEHIKTWNQVGAEIPAGDWQAWLWQQMKAIVAAAAGDRVEMADEIIKGLENPEVQDLLRRKIGQLHFFGIAVITPYYLRIFHALSACIDIHFYLINPSPEQYWLDDRSEKQITRLLQKRNRQRSYDEHFLQGNDLLLNWGNIIRETFGLLLNQDEFINLYDTRLANPHSSPKTLLHKIQHDIYHNAVGDQRQPLQEKDIHDGSFIINGCYTPLREVEVLYNHLVSLVDASTEPFPARDILVMVSDIDQYAPYIHAIFSNAPYRFPYTIADETITADNNLFTAIRQLLLVDPTRFKAEAILELLESPHIRKRFQITDVDAIREAVRQAGIIFSIAGRENDGTRVISWEHGLKKILYGICMTGEMPYHDGTETVTPLDTEEGSAALERVKLIHFIQVLISQIREWETPRTIADWAVYLNGLVEDMVFQSGESEDEDYPRFVQLTEQLSAFNPADTEPISFEVFRHSFLHRLSMEKRSQSFAGAGITFCSLIPMRSIPFRVVAMLGMDFDKFPRKESPLAFSLLTQQRLPGDRNVKDNDKHLFLETLLSAKEKLYISYTAKSAKDASDLPPSSLVDECIDYVARGMGADTDVLRKSWITIHPLHGFSNKYFGGKLLNYLSEDRFATRIPVGQQAVSTPAYNFDTIDITDLGKFMQNPVRSYYNKVLHIYYRDEETLLPDHEPFEISGWEAHRLKTALITETVPGETEKDIPAGTLPLHNLGIASLQVMKNELALLRTVFLNATAGETKHASTIRLELEDTILTGKVDQLYGQKLLCVCPSSDRLKYLLPAYTHYLALLAQGEQIDLVFIGKNISKKDTAEACTIPAGSITSEQAKNTLLEYVRHYREGHQHCFPFHPAFAKDEMAMVKLDFDAFLESIDDERNNDFNFQFKDDYLLKAIDLGWLTPQTHARLQEQVPLILEPIQQHLPTVFKKSK